MTEIQIGKRYRIKPQGPWKWAAGTLLTPTDQVSHGLVKFREGDTNWEGLYDGKGSNPNSHYFISADDLDPVFADVPPGETRVAGEPAGETRVTDPDTGGQKNSKKERYDLIPPAPWLEIVRTINDIDLAEPEMLLAGRASRFAWEFWGGGGTDCLALAGALAMAAMSKTFDDPTMVMAADEVASVYGLGADKYEKRNWERGYAWGLSFAAGMRHVMAHLGDDPVDENSSLLHLAHFVWHCMTLMTFAEHFPEKDDRSTLR